MDHADHAILKQHRTAVDGAKRQLREWMRERLAPLAEPATTAAMREELEQVSKGLFMQAADALAANAREGRPCAQVVAPLHHPGFTTLIKSFSGSMRLTALHKLVGTTYSTQFVTSSQFTDVHLEVALVGLLSGGAGFLLCAEYEVEGDRIDPTKYFDETLSALGVDTKDGYWR
jgi:hypothetical protein